MTSIAERVLDCFPSGSYALTALLRLLDIVESEAVPTAAVECRIQPRLLVNPVFVAQHAATPERLLMLVMHELHHVLLGHTTFFETVTPEQNFVFDAVINGLICRMFPQPEYTSMMTAFYDSAKFPECLLRPPPGWPQGYSIPKGLLSFDKETRASIAGLHKALYSDGGATYKEVFDVLPRQLSRRAVDRVPLLGNHGAREAKQGNTERHSPLLFDVIREIVEQWPQPPNPIQGRSLADILRESAVRPTRPPSVRAALRRLINKVASGDGHGRRRTATFDKVATQGPLPTLDRRSVVLRALGYAPLLHTRHIDVRRITRSGEQVHIYVDVSGSMDSIKGPLYGAVYDCRADVHPRIHLFSTKVADITVQELRSGVCHSTGGTEISCVAEHMARGRIRRALIVTDGYVGLPRGSHFTTLSRAKIAVAWVGTNIRKTDLDNVADYGATISLGAT